MLKSRFDNSIEPAARISQIASKLPGKVRAAHGKCGSIVFQKRAEILDETIYERGPQDRPLTGNLKKSEYISFMGNEIRIGNKALYASYRGELMEGTSVVYGHDLESRFASRALIETKEEREKIMKAAVQSALEG